MIRSATVDHDPLKINLVTAAGQSATYFNNPRDIVTSISHLKEQSVVSTVGVKSSHQPA